MMETKRSREDESDDYPDTKKVRAELIRLLDDTDVRDGDFLSVRSPAEENAAEEDVVCVMRSLEEELLGPSISADTSLSEKESDVTAIGSSDNSCIFDPLMDENGLLTTFSDDLDLAASGTGRQETCPMPEGDLEEEGPLSSGSPLGYLLGASDDELGLPPAGSSGQESPRSPERSGPPAGLIDNWQLDDELQALRAPGLELCELNDDREEGEDGCGFGSLFDHSDIADGSFVVFGGDVFS